MSARAGRPAVDVVVPFAGGAPALAELARRLDELVLGGDDSLVVVDNSPEANPPPTSRGVRVVAARDRRSSYHARNRGAALGAAPWIVFLDADVEAPADLVDAYFARPPAERTAVLAGAVRDEAPPVPNGRANAAVEFAHRAGFMSQERTLDRGEWGFAQTANCVVRRAAFESVGGFREVRSGGDADLCFRLRAAGWEIERRDEPAVVHRSRASVRALVRQAARHGAGTAWLDRAHPGSFPRRRLPGLAWWGLRQLAGGLAGGARGDRARLLHGLLEPALVWAYELGRLLPNESDRRRA